MAVSEALLEKHLVQKSLPVLLKWGAKWCGPCKAVHPLVQQLAQKLHGQVYVLDLDVDVIESREFHNGTILIPHFNSVPTFQWFYQGKCQDQLNSSNPEQIKQFVQKNWQHHQRSFIRSA